VQFCSCNLWLYGLFFCQFFDFVCHEKGAVSCHCRWRHNWKSAQVVSSHLVCDPTIRQPGFDLPRQQWSLLNRFRMEQGHCGACRRKWRLTDTDLCPCGETQTMSHIVESCPLTKLNGGLSRLHSADEDAVSWLTSIREEVVTCFHMILCNHLIISSCCKMGASHNGAVIVFVCLSVCNASAAGGASLLCQPLPLH